MNEPKVILIRGNIIVNARATHKRKLPRVIRGLGYTMHDL